MCETFDLLPIRYATFLRNSLNKFCTQRLFSPSPPLYKFQPLTVGFISIYKQALYGNSLHFYVTTRHWQRVGRVLAVRRLGLRRNDRRIRVRMSAKAKYFSSAKTCRPVVGPISLLFIVYREFFPRELSGRGVRTNTHLHLVQRIMNWVIFLHPLHTFKSREHRHFYPHHQLLLSVSLTLSSYSKEIAEMLRRIVSCFFQCVDLFYIPYFLNFHTNMSDCVESKQCWGQRPHLIAQPCKLSSTVFNLECNFSCRRYDLGYYQRVCCM